MLRGKWSRTGGILSRRMTVLGVFIVLAPVVFIFQYVYHAGTLIYDKSILSEGNVSGEIFIDRLAKGHPLKLYLTIGNYSREEAIALNRTISIDISSAASNEQHLLFAEIYGYEYKGNAILNGNSQGAVQFFLGERTFDVGGLYFWKALELIEIPSGQRLSLSIVDPQFNPTFREKLTWIIYAAFLSLYLYYGKYFRR